MKTALLVVFTAAAGALIGLMTADDLFYTSIVLYGFPLPPGQAPAISNAEAVQALRSGDLVFVESMRLPFTRRVVGAPMRPHTYILMLTGLGGLGGLLWARRMWWAR